MKELQNYHGVMMIYSALNLGCVQIFEHTWKVNRNDFLKKKKEF
jgi:hypothetical protein